METIVKKVLDYMNGENGASKKIDILDAPSQRVSMQVVLHKIENLKNEKQILCKLPHPVRDPNSVEVCLFVKDVDKKDRDYEKTIREYQKILAENSLDNIVKQIMPIKQLKLEYRPFELKRKLSSSFDLFLYDKCLHDILYNGSKLGKEFRVKKKMPIAVDLDQDDFGNDIKEILNSTVIHLNGNGPLIDIAAFTSEHTVEQAMKNIQAIKECLMKHLSGGEANIKTIYLKLGAGGVSVPIYVSKNNPNEVKLKNNITEKRRVKERKNKKIKRLEKKAKKVENGKEAKQKKGAAKNGKAKKASKTDLKPKKVQEIAKKQKNVKKAVKANK